MEKKGTFFVIFVAFVNQVAEFEVLASSLCRRMAECTRGATSIYGVNYAGERAWKLFLKVRKAKTASSARTCLGRWATNAVSKARHERSENCFLTLFPSIRERARGKKKGHLALRSILSLFFFLAITFSRERRT